MGATFSRPTPSASSPRVVFEWALGGQFLLQRAEIFKIPNPKAPNSLCVIAFDPETAAYTQHYFDSRGVVRLYKMTFERGVWTLLRDSRDFTALDFWQRFRGMFSGDGGTIQGTWENSRDGSHWERDFDLTYTKLPNREG